MSQRRFQPTMRAPLWPPAGTPTWPDLPPLPALPPCPVILGDCRVGDRVRLADGTDADVLSLGTLGVRLRPYATTTRVVEDGRCGRTVTFTVRKKAYTVAASTTAQAIVGHVDQEKDAILHSTVEATA
jgi:hypothetical protein